MQLPSGLTPAARRAMLLAGGLQVAVGLAYVLLGDRLNPHGGSAWPVMLGIIVVELPGLWLAQTLGIDVRPVWVTYGIIVLTSAVVWVLFLALLLHLAGMRRTRHAA